MNPGEAFEAQDFRPALDFGWATHLYLTPRHEDILNRFLSPQLDQDTLWARAWFLRSQLPLYPGHWGGWLFETAPTIQVIDFDRWRLPAATVHFSIVYEGGESRMLKVGGEWIMTESDLTWVM